MQVCARVSVLKCWVCLASVRTHPREASLVSMAYLQALQTQR